MAKKKVKVGDIVLYTPPVTDKTAFSNGHPGPVAAIITRIWGGEPETVSLKIVPDCGPLEDRGSVPYSLTHKEYTWKHK